MKYLGISKEFYTSYLPVKQKAGAPYVKRLSPHWEIPHDVRRTSLAVGRRSQLPWDALQQGSQELPHQAPATRTQTASYDRLWDCAAASIPIGHFDGMDLAWLYLVGDGIDSIHAECQRHVWIRQILVGNREEDHH